MPRGIKKSDWDAIHDIACEIVNASTIEDEVLGASLYQKLVEALDRLEEVYGKHPAFVATRADFHDNSLERMRLYNEARKLAEARGDEREIEFINTSIAELKEDQEG